MADDDKRHTGNSLKWRNTSDDGAWALDALNAAIAGFALDVNHGRPLVDATSKAVGRYQRIVFVEGDVPNARQLASGVTEGTLGVVLNPDGDGMAEITEFLARHQASDLAAIAIVAHGSDGMVKLGSGKLSSATIAQYRLELAAIATALGRDGTIQIYGCNIAQDASGLAFLDALSAAAGGVNVAAASHPVGAAAAGGSWDLNVQTGSADIVAPFTAATEAGFQGELLAPSTLKLFTAFNNGAGHPDAFATDIRIESMQVAGTIAATSATDIADATRNAFSPSDGLLGLVVDAPLGAYFVVNDDFGSNADNIMSGSLTGVSSTATVLAGTSGFASGGTVLSERPRVGPGQRTALLRQLHFRRNKRDWRPL